MKILTILGARPQFIKAGSVSREITKHNDIEEIIVHTGQHYDSNMSDIFFTEMNIPKPHYLLGVGGKTHGAMTGEMIEKIENVALQEKPDFMMVYGDTNSTLAGAIVASKIHTKLIHIESGLRSFNMNMPEEVNRILTDRVSSYLFCPTQTAIDNLKNEGFPYNIYGATQNIQNIGDVMLDGILYYQKYAKKPKLSDKINTYILVTIHRAENTDNKEYLKSIFDALSYISQDIDIILPIHPRTKKLLQTYEIDTNKINIIDPVGYLEMVWLIDNAKIIMTDSGGLQKEAYFLNKPCITLRDETEWVELVDIGANILVGANKDKIVNAYYNTKIDIKRIASLYGDGNTSSKIISIIKAENKNIK